MRSMVDGAICTQRSRCPLHRLRRSPSRFAGEEPATMSTPWPSTPLPASHVRDVRKVHAFLPRRCVVARWHCACGGPGRRRRMDFRYPRRGSSKGRRTTHFAPGPLIRLHISINSRPETPAWISPRRSAIIASRHGNDSNHSPANIEAPPADAGIVTYRYDTKRRRFFIRHGLNDREG